MNDATTLQLIGAFCFGLIIGWYTYYVNRYRKSDVQLGDLGTVIGVLGGGAVLALFPTGTSLFGAYGIGLSVGFFAYLLVLVLLVWRSESFTREWFLDGRKKVPDGFIVPDDTTGNRPLGEGGGGRGPIR